MNAKLILLIVALLTLVAVHHVNADVKQDLHKRKPVKDESQTPNPFRHYTCVPGRTEIKLKSKFNANMKADDYSDYDDLLGDLRDGRKKHMTTQTKDESCQVCVCSVNGIDQYCSNRPARNVNECLMLAGVMDRYNNMPFQHDRDLSQRIRRDLIWHADEIPYYQKARCWRGHSFYSNSMNANATDIDVGSDIDSLLDYSNKDTCFFCICHSSGEDIACIPRGAWYCSYYRYLRPSTVPREMYRNMFGHDRPAYFRQLSFRLRRTMDEGIHEYIDSGGDTMCCSHPDGHRRTLHNQIRDKIRQLKRKVPKENLMSGSPGGDYVDFVVNNDK